MGSALFRLLFSPLAHGAVALALAIGRPVAVLALSFSEALTCLPLPLSPTHACDSNGSGTVCPELA